MKRSTDLIHHPYRAPTDFEAPQGGIYKASTVIFPDMAAARSRDWMRKTGYTYGLHGTPTTYVLEERLCALEGGRQCVLVPSGLAAIANTALALLRQGGDQTGSDAVEYSQTQRDFVIHNYSQDGRVSLIRSPVGTKSRQQNT